MRTIADLLAEHPFFRGLPDKVITDLASCSVNRHFQPDELLFRTDDSADRMFALRSGRVALEITSSVRRPAVVETLEAGDIAGLAWLVPPYRWYLDARAVEPTSAVDIDAGCLRRHCEEDPAVGYVVMMRVAQAMFVRVQSARVRLLDLYGAKGER
jgi:CRP/FNR family transcriptional regulator, cyclic AMP receptor protein